MFLNSTIPVRGHSLIVYLQAIVIAVMLATFTGAAQAETININKADAKALQTIPGIGKKKAADIITYRKENGSFKKVDDLIKVRGIGKKTLKKIKSYITVDMFNPNTAQMQRLIS